MLIKFSAFLDQLSDFIAPRKGLLPMVGMAMILLNFILRLVPLGWLTATDFFLHLGLIIAILGLMLVWAL